MPKHTTVQTVLGTIPTSKLGPTLTHEHVLVSPCGMELDSTATLDYEGELMRVVEQLLDLQRHGVTSIIDPLPLDLGRNVDFQADCAQRSGVNIIAATGLYIDHGHFAGYPTYFKLRSLQELTTIYVKELTLGVGPRKVKPGVIKCATGSGEISPNEKKALQAAARASLETGVPIVTHTSDGSLGPEQLDIFEAEGLALNRVIVGHCSDNPNPAYHQRILDRGAFLGFDRVGMEGMVNDDVKLGVVVALVAMGYEKQLVFSHDAVGCMRGMPPRPVAPDPKNKRSYTYIHREFIPRLKQAGLGERTINAVLVENPRRLFEGG
ncbi:MAG: hypothetical protein EXR49_07570 [Dehalococcoidia bacterium]|nr:hypothetical protein [Dehalococcoidia bacterium]